MFQADSALMFDSVYVFAKGLSAMDSGHSIKPTRLSCEIEKPWDDGLSLYNYINAVVSWDNVAVFQTFYRSQIFILL